MERKFGNCKLLEREKFLDCLEKITQGQSVTFDDLSLVQKYQLVVKYHQALPSPITTPGAEEIALRYICSTHSGLPVRPAGGSIDVEKIGGLLSKFSGEIPYSYPSGISEAVASEILNQPWVLEYGYQALRTYLYIKYAI